MAYRFKLKEPLDKGFRRIGLEQIDSAQQQLSAERDYTTAVHESRKSLKRLRALLRMVRPALGEEAFHAKNAAVRDIAKLLSGTRDRHVLLATLIKLETHYGASAASAFAAVRGLLGTNGNGADHDEPHAGSAEALQRLKQFRGQFAKLKLRHSAFDVVGDGVEKSYRKTRRMFADAYRSPSEEAFHEWRKCVQIHWRHMALLSNAWPDYFGARVAAAKALSQLLGDDHDLAVLTMTIDKLGNDTKAGASDELGHAARLARTYQLDLRQAAEPLGRQLLADGPSSLRKRLAIYWAAGGDIAALGIGSEKATRKSRQ